MIDFNIFSKVFYAKITIFWWQMQHLNEIPSWFPIFFFLIIRTRYGRRSQHFKLSNPDSWLVTQKIFSAKYLWKIDSPNNSRTQNSFVNCLLLMFCMELPLRNPRDQVESTKSTNPIKLSEVEAFKRRTKREERWKKKYNKSNTSVAHRIHIK